jgi:hypothetical protein
MQQAPAPAPAPSPTRADRGAAAAAAAAAQLSTPGFHPLEQMLAAAAAADTASSASPPASALPDPAAVSAPDLPAVGTGCAEHSGAVSPAPGGAGVAAARAVPHGPPLAAELFLIGGAVAADSLQPGGEQHGRPAQLTSTPPPN